MIMATETAEETDHARALLFKIQELRDMNYICDFTIKVGNKSLSTHRLILAAFSDYFRAMFSNDMRENRQGFVELVDMDANAVTKCVELMYTGKASLEINWIEKVFQVADMLQFSEMTAYCTKFLEKSLSVENCLLVKEISDAFNLEKMIRKADDFSVKYFEEVSQTKRFRDLSVTKVIGLMENSKMNVEILWRAALSWMQSPSNKECDFLQIFRRLDFDDCCLDFLLKMVWKEDTVRKSKSCRNIIVRSLVKSYESESGNISIGDLCDILEIAKNYGREFCKGFVAKVHNILAENFEDFIKHSQFLDININDIIEIFNYLEEDSQERAFIAAIEWIKHLQEKRTKYLPRILENIKLLDFSPDFLLNIVLKEPLVKQSEVCSKSVVSALLSNVEYSDINEDNWYAYLRISKLHADLCPLEASEAILTFTKLNFTAISSQDRFVGIPYKVFCDLLEYQTIKRSSSEETQWQAVLKWTKHDLANRSRHLSNLLKLIRLQRLSHDYLQKNIFAEEIVKSSHECLNTIIEAVFAKVLSR